MSYVFQCIMYYASKEDLSQDGFEQIIKNTKKYTKRVGNGYQLTNEVDAVQASTCVLPNMMSFKSVNAVRQICCS